LFVFATNKKIRQLFCNNFFDKNLRILEWIFEGENVGREGENGAMRAFRNKIRAVLMRTLKLFMCYFMAEAMCGWGKNFCVDIAILE